jgi:NTE family protein
MTSDRPQPPRVGLVLGAGGTTGAAFHAGTLLALEQDLGWDPRSADLVIGSSAGSIVGGLLRAGLSTDDLAAWAAAAEARPDGLDSRRLLDELDAHRFSIVAPRLRLPVPTLGLLAGLRNSSQRVGLHTAAMSLLPFGLIDGGAALARLGELTVGWPARPLWITAVRVSNGRRVVFGRDPIDATLGHAIAASCAIPAVFRPVRVGAHHYIDGGAHSPTNADLLVDAGVDAAIVLSPMSARPSSAHRPSDRFVRSIFARRLDHERSQLERAGIAVHVIEPDLATVEAMGRNALSRRRTAAVVRASFLGAGRQLVGSGDLAALLRAHRAATDARANDAATLAPA